MLKNLDFLATDRRDLSALLTFSADDDNEHMSEKINKKQRQIDANIFLFLCNPLALKITETVISFDN